MKKNELIEVKKNGVSAYDLHSFLGVSTQFAMWIKRRFHDYGFTEGKDFSPTLVITNGRPITDYILSLNTAKEIAVVEKTAKGQEIRRYLIEVENKYRAQIERDSSKLTRRTLTDIIEDSGEAERTHGHAYSLYTKMIYKKLGIEYVKMNNFRDTLNPEQLKLVEAMEKLAEGYLRLGYDYSTIKQALPDCILQKQKELENDTQTN
jgi:phage anti-repressor protein